MRIVRFEPSHIALLDNFGGQETLAGHVKERDLNDLASRGFAVSGFAGERLIGCAGLIEATPLRAIAWALFAKHHARDFMAIDRAVRRVFADCPYRKIEAYVDPRMAPAMRWADLLGFTLVTFLPLHFPDGSPAAYFVLYPKD